MDHDQLKNTLYIYGRFENHRVTLDKPKLVSFFSIGKHREYLNDSSNLLYYFSDLKDRNDVNFNLNLDIDNKSDIIKKSNLLSISEKIDHLLNCIKFNLIKAENITNLSKIGKLLDTDFICYRGLLTTLLCTQYEKDGWIICANLYKGNIYLCAFMTEKRYNHIINASDYEKQCTTWGYKFEQFLLTEDPKIPPKAEIPINENEEFSCVYKNKLGNNILLYGAEMDGIISESKIENVTVENLKSKKFVELKTNKVIENDRQNFNFKRYKHLKWWCQSTLVGIDDIVCGFRDENGLVKDLKCFDVDDLAYEPYKLGMWQIRYCFNFANNFFEYVKKIIKRDTNNFENVPTIGIWKFEKPDCENFINVTKIDNLDSEYNFLPKWYTEHVETLIKQSEVEN